MKLGLKLVTFSFSRQCPSSCQTGKTKVCYKMGKNRTSSTGTKAATTVYCIHGTTYRNNTTQELSFEWSHFRISSTDSKVKTTLYSIINSTTERVLFNSFHLNHLVQHDKQHHRKYHSVARLKSDFRISFTESNLESHYTLLARCEQIRNF